MNYTSNPVDDLAAALYSAIFIDLPDVVYHDRDWEKWRALSAAEKAKLTQDERGARSYLGPTIERRRRPHTGDVTVYAMFPQTWASTAMGFGGVGGASITTAYTVVIQHERHFAVYFHGRFAYRIEVNGSTTEFVADVANKRVASRRDAAKRYGAIHGERDE